MFHSLSIGWMEGITQKIGFHQCVRYCVMWLKCRVLWYISSSSGVVQYSFSWLQQLVHLKIKKLCVEYNQQLPVFCFIIQEFLKVGHWLELACIDAEQTDSLISIAFVVQDSVYCHQISSGLLQVVRFCSCKMCLKLASGWFAVFDLSW